MPIYEYHCEECNANFEYLVFGQEKPDACTSCGSTKIDRLMSACSFKSKGSSGETVASSSSSCSGCSATSCSSCGV